MRNEYKGLILFVVGMFIGMGITMWVGSQDDPEYNITCRVVEAGIEYSVNMTAGYRTDVIYKTMDSTVAYAIWYGFYANRNEGTGYDVQDYTPQGQDGVYNPDDLANRKDPSK